ncbi:MAG: pyrroline-5-carboxylate reductase [Candidatus Sericytochromatia bacterium]|nr:MAG: pyrroline-5-carboxylate reductase [Candidatus Sericytochromatia bacterium]
MIEEYKKISIVGAGVMGEVILDGIISSNLYSPKNVLITALRPKNLEIIKEKYNVNISTDNRTVVNFSDIIILAVKPNNMESVIKEISNESLKNNTIIISIAAGISIKKISNLFNKNLPIIRVMTNTACMVKNGMSVLCGNEFVTPYQMNIAKEIFNSVGETMTLQEKYFDAVTGLSGSGPGFLFLIAETLIDAGVLQGLPRDVSRKLVIETMLGSSLLLKKTDKHPAPLKDMVTSPGGTTIAGIQVMEEYKVRAALLKVVEVATKKSKELGEI